KATKDLWVGIPPGARHRSSTTWRDRHATDGYRRVAASTAARQHRSMPYRGHSKHRTQLRRPRELLLPRPVHVLVGSVVAPGCRRASAAITPAATCGAEPRRHKTRRPKPPALNAEDALKAAYAEIDTHRERIGILLGQIRDLQAEYTEGTAQRLADENITLN